MAAVAINHHMPRSQVAQQVMGLFQGALDFEKELAIFEEESAKAYAAFGLSEKPTSKESDSSSRDQVNLGNYYCAN